MNIARFIFSSVNVTCLIIISHIATILNYRMAVPAGSDFLAYHYFPEVYHGEGINKAAFSCVHRPVERKRVEHNIWCITSPEKR